MNHPLTLAIIGTCPKELRRVVRTSKFADFQRICGELEAHSYLAGHAACHATMNGFERVLFAAATPDSEPALTQALRDLVQQGPFDALVVPGLVDLDLQLAICEEFEGLAPQFVARILFDAPQKMPVEDVVTHQARMPDFAHIVMPWVMTHSPGRRVEECLPPSTVAAALCCYITQNLRGVHRLSDTWSVEDAAYCAQHGVCGLYTFGRRSQIGLYKQSHTASGDVLHAQEDIVSMPLERLGPLTQGPHAEPMPFSQHESAVEAQLMAQIDARCAGVLQSYSANNSALWQALRRSAESVLRVAKEEGKILHYVVRCDEETASWGTPTSPVMEILLSFPQRVSQLHICTSKLG